MKAVFLFTLMALAALLVQTTVLPQALFGRSSPDLLLILCVYLALRRHSVGGALGAFSLGYLQDTFSGSILGLNAFGMSVVFLLIYLTSRRLWVDNVISQIAVVFVASVVKTSTILVLVAVFVSIDGLGRTILSYLFTEALLASILSPAIFAILARTQLIAVTEEA